MSKMRVLSRIDDTLRTHLELGGRLSDKVSQELVEKYAKAALTIDEIQDVASRYDLSQHEIEVMFTGAIESVLNHYDFNPCINTAPNALPMLTASLIFREPFRLENLLKLALARLPEDPTPEERQEMLVDAAIEMSEETWLSHTQARGKARFQVLEGGRGLPSSKTGCFSLIFLAALIPAAGWKLTHWLS
jgi:hypothetical protein